MKKRFLFYSFQAIVVFLIIQLAIIAYWMNFNRANEFLAERFGNVLLIFFLILVLSSFFNLLTYRGFKNKDYDFIREFISILGRTFIIILIVSFAEFFIFYRTKIGRVIYVNLFLLLSIFYVLESWFINTIISKKKQRVLWLSTIPFSRVEKEYLQEHSNIDVYEPQKKTQLNDGYDAVIFDYPPKKKTEINGMIRKIITMKNPTDLITYIENTTEMIPLKYVDDLWLLKNIRTYESAYDKIRRVFNFISSLILLLILFPFAFLFAVIHRIGSRGALFYLQKREGYRGRIFNMIKFRTMVDDAERDGPQFAHHNDDRITGIGKIMRKYRIDEVPQLINVLKGDMNLIGPRPEREDFVEMLEEQIPYYKLRLEVRPGLTGWAQVNFPYAGWDLKDHMHKLEYDFYYIKNRSFPLDILILLKTIKTMLSKRGT